MLAKARTSNAINGKEVREALTYAMNSGISIHKDIQKIMSEDLKKVKKIK